MCRDCLLVVESEKKQEEEEGGGGAGCGAAAQSTLCGEARGAPRTGADAAASGRRNVVLCACCQRMLEEYEEGGQAEGQAGGQAAGTQKGRQRGGRGCAAAQCLHSGLAWPPRHAKATHRATHTPLTSSTSSSQHCSLEAWHSATAPPPTCLPGLLARAAAGAAYMMAGSHSSSRRSSREDRLRTKYNYDVIPSSSRCCSIQPTSCAQPLLPSLHHHRAGVGSCGVSPQPAGAAGAARWARARARSRLWHSASGGKPT